MREYTIGALLGMVAVVFLEVRFLRTRLLQTRAYWIAIVICYGFMIAVNGWLTKLSAPVVRYDERRTTGWRVPWDIPVEDYLFGFALLTLAMLLWEKARDRRGGTAAPVSSAARSRL
jgi:lycopene cyclase domain-containing protein